MPQPTTCPQCGTELKGRGLGGLCHRCVGRGVLAPEDGTVETMSEADSEAKTTIVHKEHGDTLSAPPRKTTPELGSERYRLLNQIGEGGFGEVYLAEQVEPVKRRVVIKILKPGMDSKQVVARFEAERQALALMDHPYIARVNDAGMTATGRPYFVMEWIQGIRVTHFCEQHRLPTRARLELFINICQAVQHAHQKGIIHRDLKPSNIMVVLHEGVPVPKVIDFGIAKAVGGMDLTDKTLFTGLQQFLGTPSYMSPEQAAMGGVDIDTRSDIYSLGVLLYELLTGRTPFDAKTLLDRGIEELILTLREVEPQRPSTRLKTLGAEELNTLARQHGTESAQLKHLVRGDLDWIVMMCLEKDRNRRYESAHGLAMDIRRHLSCEPVLARPPSKLYEFQKTLRRHKVGFAATAGIIVALALGISLAVWQAARATQSEREQRALRQEAEFNAYAADMNLASRAYAAGDIARVSELLDKHRPESSETQDLRGFEWYHWWQSTHLDIDREPPRAPLNSLAISPDRQLYALGSYPGWVSVRSTLDHREVTPAIAIGDAGNGSRCVFSPDGGSLLVSSERLTVFDTATWTRKDIAVPGGGRLDALAFSPIQSRMASGGEGGGIVFWNTKTWEPVGQSLEPRGFVRGLTFTADGAKLIAAMDDSRIVVWDLARRVVERTLIGHYKSVRSVVHSPTANLFATGSSDQTVRLWNDDFELLGTYDADAPVSFLEFSPEGQQLLTGTSVDNSLLVWNVGRQPPSLRLLHVVKGHSRAVTGAAFLSATNTVMSISEDGSRMTWNLSRCEPSVWLGQIPMKASDFANPSRLSYAHEQNGLWVTDPEGKRHWSNLDSPGVGAPPDPEGFRTLAVTEDGALRAGATDDGHLGIWDTHRGEVVARHPALAAEARSVVVFSGGPTVVWGTQNIFQIWNIKQNTTRTLGAVMHGLPDVSPRGDRMASHEWRTSMVWDITVDPPRRVWQAEGWGPEFCTVFSPDGDLVAAANSNNTVRLLDAETGTLVGTLKGHTAAVRSVNFSHDGRRIVSGGADGTVRIWDTRRGQLLSSFVGRDGTISSVAFAPDDNSVASLADNGVLRLWTAASRQEADQRVEH
jgi:eukaryotic-like serine/threonine-protein kinase